MKTFSFVEDYIEFIAGMIDINGNRVSVFMPYVNPVISLARYDESPVRSFAHQVFLGTGFTDRQSSLAVQLVSKYAKQLKKLNVDVSPVINEPKFRFSIRQVDRTKELTLDKDGLVLRFPYDTNLIENVRKFAKTSEGAVHYKADSKTWRLALTESCVNYAVALAKAYNFDIEPVIAKMAEDIIAEETAEYHIQLEELDGKLIITNAPESLINYINEHLGGFALDNVKTLIDYSDILGYSVHPALVDTLANYRFACSSEFKIRTKSDELSKLVEYAREYNRFPIISYVSHDVMFNNDLDQFFDASEIVTYTRNKPDKEITETTKLIHIRGRAAKEWTARIPLLVCYTNMMFGAEKSILLQNAEKLCYYCDAFYKKD